MWRGFSRFGSRVNAAMARHPFLTSVTITGAKAAAADLMIQTMIEKREKVDTTRLGLFGLFGFTYQGGFQYGLYAKLFERIWPGTSMRMNICKVLATNLIVDPVFFFPVFYAMREYVFNAGGSDSTLTNNVKNGLLKYKENYKDDWFNTWAVWFPGHTVTYCLMPTHLRMPWIAFVSFGYVSLLSYTRGDFADSEATPQPELGPKTPTTCSVVLPQLTLDPVVPQPTL